MFMVCTLLFICSLFPHWEKIFSRLNRKRNADYNRFLGGKRFKILFSESMNADNRENLLNRESLALIICIDRAHILLRISVTAYALSVLKTTLNEEDATMTAQKMRSVSRHYFGDAR